MHVMVYVWGVALLLRCEVVKGGVTGGGGWFGRRVVFKRCVLLLLSVLFGYIGAVLRVNNIVAPVFLPGVNERRVAWVLRVFLLLVWYFQGKVSGERWTLGTVLSVVLIIVQFVVKGKCGDSVYY